MLPLTVTALHGTSDRKQQNKSLGYPVSEKLCVHWLSVCVVMRAGMRRTHG